MGITCEIPNTTVLYTLSLESTTHFCEILFFLAIDLNDFTWAIRVKSLILYLLHYPLESTICIIAVFKKDCPCGKFHNEQLNHFRGDNGIVNNGI